MSSRGEACIENCEGRLQECIVMIVNGGGEHRLQPLA